MRRRGNIQHVPTARAFAEDVRAPECEDRMLDIKPPMSRHQIVGELFASS